MRLLPLKSTLVILTLVALMKAPDAMPAFKDYKVLDFHNIPAVLDFQPRKASAAPIEDEQMRMHPDKDAASYKIFRLNDPNHSLDHFFEALQRTESRVRASGRSSSGTRSKGRRACSYRSPCDDAVPRTVPVGGAKSAGSRSRGPGRGTRSPCASPALSPRR